MPEPSDLSPPSGGTTPVRTGVSDGGLAAPSNARTGSRAVRVFGPLGLVGLVVVASACGSNFGAPDGVTTQSSGFTSLWRTFFILAVAVCLLIWVLVAWSIIRYRRRVRPEMPSQRQYNIPLEVTYLLIPLVIVFVLFGLTLVATDEFTSLAAEPEVHVEVHGFQWQWQFDYPDEGIRLSADVQEDGAEIPPELVIPVGQTIQLRLVSTDVNHSFWVPEFLEKRDLIPNVDNEIQILVEEPGTWVGRCAEYCGLDHWTMTFTVRALPAEEYEAWVDEVAAMPQPVLAGQLADGGDAGATAMATNRTGAQERAS